MAKKGKHLSAATRQKISESVKRAAAARAKSTTAKVEPFRITEMPGLAPRTSREEAMQLATDVIDLVSSEISPAVLVRVVDRILRP